MHYSYDCGVFAWEAAPLVFGRDLMQVIPEAKTMKTHRAYLSLLILLDVKLLENKR